MTDDLPTPPLPEAIASTRVRESVNGFGAGSCRCSRRRCGVRCVSACALLVGHDREVDVDVVDAGEAVDRVGDPAA